MKIIALLVITIVLGYIIFMTNSNDVKLEKATLGAGCFWGVEKDLSEIKGVKSTVVGYMGGTTENPTYEEVSSGNTGHTEVVQIEFDPLEVSYKEILLRFWSIHDSSKESKRQYRSVIFYHNDEQRRIAEELKRSKSSLTSIEHVQAFWKAEDYHQKYFLK